MPVIGTSPWTDAANVGQGVASGIGAIGLQIPQARAQAALMKQQLLQQQQQMALQAQAAPYQRSALAARAGRDTGQGQMYQANAGYKQAQTTGLQQQQQVQVQLGQAAGDAMQESVATGQMKPETASRLAQAMFTASKTDPNLMKQFSQLAGLGQQHLQKNPAMANALATGARVQPVMDVRQGGTMADTATGQPLMQGTEKLNPGQVSTQPQQVQGQGQLPSPLAIAGQSPYPPQMKSTNPNAAMSASLAKALMEDPSAQGRLAGVMQQLQQYGLGPQTNRTQGAQGSPAQPQVIQDKSGKHWVYKGNMADPRQDKNEQNWEQVPNQ